MKRVLLPLLILPLLPGWVIAQDEGWRPLFNGRDLSGWQRVNTHESTWKVEDGLLICSGKPIGELRTDRMYQNFILEVEWRHMVPRGNAGIFVWADDITARGVPFHRSIEVQVLENAYGNNDSHTTHGDIFPIHGATMTPINGRGGSRAFPTEFRSNPSPEWNHYRIACRDGDISLAVNGKVVTQGKDCSPRKGYICLESEGGIVHYRNLRIRELPDTPIAADDTAIADRGYHCLYTGVDLSEWTMSDSGVASWQANDWVLAFDGRAEGDDAALKSATDTGGDAFIVDVRFREASGPLEIRFRGATLRILPDSPQLEPAGRWNRVEAQRDGSGLKVTVNGRPVSNAAADRAETAGPLTLVPDGPTDFANIYVRDE